MLSPKYGSGFLPRSIARKCRARWLPFHHELKREHCRVTGIRPAESSDNCTEAASALGVVRLLRPVLARTEPAGGRTLCSAPCQSRTDARSQVSLNEARNRATDSSPITTEKCRNCCCVKSDRSPLIAARTTPQRRDRPTFSGWTSTCLKQRESVFSKEKRHAWLRTAWNNSCDCGNRVHHSQSVNDHCPLAFAYRVFAYSVRRSWRLSDCSGTGLVARRLFSFAPILGARNLTQSSCHHQRRKPGP